MTDDRIFNDIASYIDKYPEGESKDNESFLAHRVYRLVGLYGLETVLMVLMMYFEERASIQKRDSELEKFYLSQAEMIARWMGTLGIKKKPLSDDGGDH